MSSLPTGTVTFLFTDIEGSTKLAQEHPDKWESLRAKHHAILQSAMDAHNGYVFQIIGDAFCVAFHTATDGLNAAIQAQRVLQTSEFSKNSEVSVRVRMGIHTGEAELQTKGDYHGYLAMSRVQRLMSAGHGGQVLISQTTQELIRDKLPKEVTLRDMGEHKLKDVPLPVRIFQVVAPDLQNEFPVLRTLSVFPNNLPTQITSFVGREKELADVKKLLQDAHMLTLIGPGGTGKTRLSIQAASESLEQYHDGVWLVELAPILDPLLVPRTTAIAIGLRDEPQRPVIDMLCDYLREKKMLILLDNCEHLVDACAQMANKILRAAPNIRVLASSREALGIAGEVTYRVPSLGLPDMNHLPSVESLSQYEAVKLFIDRATSAVPSFTVTNDNAPFLAQICHRLDGIPLAIELAAAKVRVLNMEQIAKRLDDRFRLLTGGSRTALERHQTLRATIDWSYNLLPIAEQILFRRLSVFVGGWTLEAAEAVCSDDSIKGDDVLDLLEHLINKSIVIKEETGQKPRYHMLETMRQYANEKFVESGESDALRDQHLEYFLTLVETAAPHLIRSEQLEWLAQLDGDYENLRAALEWSLSKETPESSLRLCAALGRYWHLRTYWLEGSKWLKSALSLPTKYSSQAEKIARVRALYEDADLADQIDDIERLKTSGEQSLALAQNVSDRKDILIAKYEVANALYRHDWEIEKSYQLMEECFAGFEEIDEPYWASRTYSTLINIPLTDDKRNYYEMTIHALRLARKAGEGKIIADALIWLGNWFYIIGMFADALEYANEASLLYKQLGANDLEILFINANIAWINGNLDQAISYFLDIQNRLEILGEKNTLSITVECLGRLALEQSNLNQAQAYFHNALRLAREINNKITIARLLAEIGITYYLQTNRGECKRNLKDGILLVKEVSIYPKRYILLLIADFIPFQVPELSAKVLGSLHASQKEGEVPIEPLNMRYYNQAEKQARERLDDLVFKSAFAEGQKMSLDDALDLILKTLEAM